MTSSQTAQPLPITDVAPKGGRKRIEMGFDKAHLLQAVFGDYDANIIAIENRLNVVITARGQNLRIDGEAGNVAVANEVLLDLYRHAERGTVIDQALVEAQFTITTEPTLRGIVHPRGNAVPMVSIRTRLKTITPRTPAQATYMMQMASNEMVFGLGPAGTGKTYLAVAQAVSQLIAGNVQRVILSRPAVEAGEKLGFLPGDMKDKVDPYLRPLYDALNDCMPPEQVERRIASGEIEIAPIAFMRGRTLADAFIILDEAQNTTPSQMKMVLTRFGQNSRMVVCGDPNQTDLPGGPAASGLADAMRRLDGVEGIAFTRFGIKDVVRHPIVGRIVDAYEGTGGSV